MTFLLEKYKIIVIWKQNAGKICCRWDLAIREADSKQAEGEILQASPQAERSRITQHTYLFPPSPFRRTGNYWLEGRSESVVVRSEEDRVRWILGSRLRKIRSVKNAKNEREFLAAVSDGSQAANLGPLQALDL